MSTDAIKKLQETIVPRIRLRFSNGRIDLHENQKNTFLKHFIIGGIDEECIAINLDKVGFANKVLQNSKGLKACDAVVFCHLDNQGYILILEMKSSIPSETEKENDSPIWQLKAGDCFADYLLSVLEHVEEIKTTMGWQRRYFIFHCNHRQRDTLPDYATELLDNDQANKPHIMFVNNDEIVPLRKLLGKPL